MNAWMDRLGEGFIRVIEQLVPAAAQLEEHSVLIGQCLALGFAVVIVWSVSGLARRR